MSIEIKTPELPESVDEATLLTWHVEQGSVVNREDKIADVETDKVVLEVYAPADGSIEQLVEEGGVLGRDDVIARLAEGAEISAKAPAASPSESQTASKPEVESVTDKPETSDTAPEVDLDALNGLSPSVRRLLIEHDISPEQITGTGRDGKIKREDVVRYIEEIPVAQKNIGLGVASGLVSSAAKAPKKAKKPDDPYTKRVPMSQLRARVATRLKEVQNEQALLSTFNEVNMKPVMDLRKKYKDRFEQEYGVKLGFMSFFVKATVEALKKYPIVNASLDGRDILYHEAYHMGIAVDSPRGLVVPVLRHAEHMSFAEVEQGIRELAGKARDAKLAYEDLVGGTFTITNGGVFGSMLSTPIVNAPQSAILGMHAIQERPWVENGEVVVRPVMYLALSYDHRIIDGRDAVQFLVSIKESLEDPAQLMLQL